jgi:desulfoferrodoxin-like iron-binding protein
MNSWKCDSCGAQYDANEPPEICHSCGKSCEFREITNYVPKMDRAGREYKCEVCGNEITITIDGGGMLKCCDQLMILKNS